MGLFRKIAKIFGPSEQTSTTLQWIEVKCQRCGEIIRARIDLRNDLSIEYNEEGDAYYFCRKVLIGESGLCFQRVEVELTFDENRRLINREISSGLFIDETV